MKELTYHNSFIICDSQEAFVLETAKDLWAVEKVTGKVGHTLEFLSFNLISNIYLEGYRNISNCLSIGTDIYMMSNELKTKALELGLWNGQGDFHFANIFSGHGTNGCQRFESGSQLLGTLTASEKKFNAQSMFQILRDENSGICMREGAFLSTSSMVNFFN